MKIKAPTSILGLFLLSGFIIHQPTQVVDPCSEKVDRIISIFKNELTKAEFNIGACIMSPIEDEVVDIFKNHLDCFKGIPFSDVFDYFPGGIQESNYVGEFEIRYRTILYQCYYEGEILGFISLEVFTNDDLIETLNVSFFDSRTITAAPPTICVTPKHWREAKD